MKKTIWKSILCAMLVTLTACILCIGAFAAKYTCIKSGCNREAAKGSAYCWVHKPSKSNSSVSGSSSSIKHKYTCIKDCCTREADKDSDYCGVHRPSKSSTKSSTSYSSKSSYSSSYSSSKNPTRRMIPMTMATMPSMMMTTTMRIATTATRTTQQA